jgi:hypothetical protein
MGLMWRITKMFRLLNNYRIRGTKSFSGKAQSTLEYAIIVIVVIAALTAMSVYVRRAVQSKLMMVEKQINNEP